MDIKIDLFSDTMTKPTAEMRRFMCNADGDEQKGEDPTVNLAGDGGASENRQHCF